MRPFLRFLSIPLKLFFDGRLSFFFTQHSGDILTTLLHQAGIIPVPLKKLSGITNTMLTNALRELARDGLVVREQFNEIPPHVEYSFSEMGKDLLPVFYAMMIWGLKHEDDITSP